MRTVAEFMHPQPGPDLTNQQQALLGALWLPRHADACAALAAHLPDARPLQRAQWERGLLAYRSNARLLAQRALAAGYPVLAQLLGEENFQALANDHWLKFPPRLGDVGRWGGELAVHMTTVAELMADAPYLPDVARVEWALHAAAYATDETQDRDSLAALGAPDAEAAGLRIARSAICVPSVFPGVTIIEAHAHGEAALTAAGALLAQGVSQTALVWRDGLQPRLRQALPGEEAFMASLRQGALLSDALAAAPELDFVAWLPPAVAEHLLLGVTPVLECFRNPQ